MVALKPSFVVRQELAPPGGQRRSRGARILGESVLTHPPSITPLHLPFQPNVTPGNCWAFAGDRGQVTIRLAQKVYLSNLTLQHIPKTISLSGSLDTAPKDFVIYVSTPRQGAGFP